MNLKPEIEPRMSTLSIRPLTGLVAATHTPFDSDGNLRLAVVEEQAALLIRDGVSAVFIGGTTGESHSLTLDERLALCARWRDVESKGVCVAATRPVSGRIERVDMRGTP